MNNPAGSGHPAYIHGKTHTKIYRLWQNMLQRCYNPNCPEYQRYGKRGIKVCKRWHIFKSFYKDVGDPPIGKSFDRIDNSQGYKPSNWRWATPKEQSANTRTTILITAFGQTKSLNSWHKDTGIHGRAILKRITVGWTPEEAVPARPRQVTSPSIEAKIRALLQAGASIVKIQKELKIGKTLIRRIKTELVRNTVDIQLHESNQQGADLLKSLLDGKVTI